MDQQIISRYNQAILHEAMQCYGIAKDQIKPLDAFESFILVNNGAYETCPAS